MPGQGAGATSSAASSASEAVAAGWGSVLIGMAVMALDLAWFPLYAALFVAAFVLGVRAMARRRIRAGAWLAGAAIVVPLVAWRFLVALRRSPPLSADAAFVVAFAVLLWLMLLLRKVYLAWMGMTLGVIGSAVWCVVSPVAGHVVIDWRVMGVAALVGLVLGSAGQLLARRARAGRAPARVD